LAQAIRCRIRFTRRAVVAAFAAVLPFAVAQAQDVKERTFKLALHAWDEPAETLYALGPKQGVQLVMPRLGEPVEPAHVERVTPWWRGVDARDRAAPVIEPAPMTLPKSMPWPVD